MPAQTGVALKPHPPTHSPEYCYHNSTRVSLFVCARSRDLLPTQPLPYYGIGESDFDSPSYPVLCLLSM